LDTSDLNLNQTEKPKNEIETNKATKISKAKSSQNMIYQQMQGNQPASISHSSQNATGSLGLSSSAGERLSSA